MHSSFYIYSTYALIFHDERDKDLVIFLIHHLIVILISTISYAVGKTYLTSAVGFLLELNEILMAMKIIFKLQFQFIQKNGEKLRLVFLPVFTITFVHTRLFIYPYIVLECLQFLKQSLGKSEWDAIYLSIYFFYFMIYIMNFYWTLLVIRATVYAFRNGLANLEDRRG
ncbi:uncharacterized protein LOC113797831 [Dermatophagoides pteronyssinus]|uniref:LAG1 longevity assurance homolog 2-like n=1 Tax=Dermatophagoides pteronyssinus TaxID=6956 RepID=A0A6P6YF18_DERPT|nr:LAG1 longevity assurance homolog 2-like [Dermatophagoides pteronyssinus]